MLRWLFLAYPSPGTPSTLFLCTQHGGLRFSNGQQSLALERRMFVLLTRREPEFLCRKLPGTPAIELGFKSSMPLAYCPLFNRI